MSTRIITAEDVDNTNDIIDSRDIIERITDLTDRTEDPDQVDPLDEDETRELAQLKALADEASGYPADRQYGEALIRDSYFTQYAEQLADDIGAIKADAGWPLDYIDWEAAAEALQVDYSTVEHGNITYWIR